MKILFKPFFSPPIINHAFPPTYLSIKMGAQKAGSLSTTTDAFTPSAKTIPHQTRAEKAADQVVIQKIRTERDHFRRMLTELGVCCPYDGKSMIYLPHNTLELSKTHPKETLSRLHFAPKEIKRIASLDHIVPRSQKADEENTTPLEHFLLTCQDCNQTSRNNLNLLDFLLGMNHSDHLIQAKWAQKLADEQKRKTEQQSTDKKKTSASWERVPNLKLLLLNQKHPYYERSILRLENLTRYLHQIEALQPQIAGLEAAHRKQKKHYDPEYLTFLENFNARSYAETLRHFLQDTLQQDLPGWLNPVFQGEWNLLPQTGLKPEPLQFKQWQLLEQLGVKKPTGNSA